MWTESWSGGTDGIRPVLLVIHGAEWRFSIVNVTRVASALIVRIVLSGPDQCEVVVRISGGYIAGDTAKQILDAAWSSTCRRQRAAGRSFSTARSRTRWPATGRSSERFRAAPNAARCSFDVSKQTDRFIPSDVRYQAGGLALASLKYFRADLPA